MFMVKLLVGKLFYNTKIYEVSTETFKTETMKPEEQAQHIYDKFRYEIAGCCINDLSANNAAHDAAILCVQMIILANPQSNPLGDYMVHSTMEYWMEVKKEIELI